jgi:tRNA-(ms[2]io[6]A)-hydroxylase
VILQNATPDAWIRAAVEHWQDLMRDHANCEKKAASTAMALMFAYPEDRRLALRMARLAREELRHFEQVDKLMQQLDVPPRRLSPGRYAGELRKLLTTHEPARKLDLMIVGALIESRSCERFERVAPHLPEPIGSFYADLAVAERRHESLYLDLAREAALAMTIDAEQAEALLAQRLATLSQAEAELVSRPDPQFRFHSGPPAVAA